jgi:predicted outer membrane repeat protein
MHRIAVAVFALLLLECFGSALHAETWEVPSEALTIQAGIDSASAGDTVLVECGTYLEYDILMKSGVTLLSETGQYDCVTIDADSLGRALICSNVDSTASVIGFTLTGGLTGPVWLDDAGAGAWCESSSLAFRNCHFTDNSTASNAGGLMCKESALTLIDCVFSDNSATSSGGFFSYGTPSPTLTGCDFTGNSASIDGGGLYTYFSSPELDSCIFTGNSALNSAGGVYCSNSPGVSLDNCAFTGNTGSLYGGGLFTWESGVTLTNCSLIQNSALHGGGARFGLNSGVTLDSCVLAGNSATGEGGGLFTDDCSPSLSNCPFHGHSAGTIGGGLRLYNSSPSIATTIIAFSSQGEAVACTGVSNPTLTCCDVYGNSGGDWTGCIAGQDTLNDNFSADPRFCLPDSGDFRVSETSPCVSLPGCGLVGAFGPGCLKGGVWVVPTDAPTIQAGIDTASAGDTVLVTCGTYQEYDILMKSGVTLLSETGQYDCVTIDADSLGRVLICNNVDSTASVIGFTLTGGLTGPGWLGDAGAGAWCDSSSLAFRSCHFTDNSTASNAAGLMCKESALTVIDCVFSDNSATSGTGFFSYGTPSPTLTGCDFTSNSASIDGGGFYAYFSSPQLDSCTFTGNSALNSVGGVYCVNSSGVGLSNCTFTGNTCAQYGGGLMTWVSGVTLTSCSFIQNSALNSGGARIGQGSVVTLDSCVFAGNSATGGAGGGLSADDCSPSLSSCTFYGNSAGISGGGLKLHNSSPTIANTIIAFSTLGEAVSCTGVSNPALTCSDVYGNAGGDYIECLEGQDTLSGNFSADPGFCDPDNGDYWLRSDSPCLRAACGPVGPYGRGCIGWLPFIAAISDIGNDQGRSVRIAWERTLYDAPGDTVDITGYEVYRRQDEYLATGGPPDRDARERSGRISVLQQSGWDYCGTAPAHGESLYQYVVPTLCDSTDQGVCWSIFFIRAASTDPFEYFDSYADSGYSVDNLAPAPPPGLIMSSPTDLAWEEVPDEDFDYFTVYGSSASDLDSSATIVGYTINTMMDVTGHLYDHYHVSATDFAGNEGEASSVENTFAGASPAKSPATYALRQNRPNPFGERTVIAFDLPRPGEVRLEVYDARGRLVRILTDEIWPAGRHSLVWRGENESGHPSGPGAYFIRIKAGDFEDSKKIVLMR